LTIDRLISSSEGDDSANVALAAAQNASIVGKAAFSAAQKAASERMAASQQLRGGE
jgi:hypothetical protein